jgi:hypothetical protein
LSPGGGGDRMRMGFGAEAVGRRHSGRRRSRRRRGSTDAMASSYLVVMDGQRWRQSG